MQTNGQAAIYCRISSDPEGREFGVQRQEQDCRVLADRLGLEVAEVFVDNDISASSLSKKRRPRFEEMLGRAEGGEFAAILAYSNSRLTRRPREWELLIDLYEDHRVVVHTVASGTSDLSTADGRGNARSVAVWDALEAERVGERVARAVQQRAEQGKWHGGFMAIGYRRVINEVGKTTGVEPDPVYAPLVRDAASRVLAGESIYSIAKDWNGQGLSTPRGAHWRSGTIRRTLMSPMVIGRRAYHGKIFPGKWEPIITEEQWNRLQDLLRDPGRKYGPVDGSYAGKRALGGLAFCGLCGKKLISGRHVRGPRMICHQQATGGCGKVTVNYAELESFVLDMVFERLDDPTFHEAASRPVTPRNQRQDQLRQERDTLDTQWQRVQEAYEAGAYTVDELKSRRAKIDKKRESLDAELGEIAAEQVLGDVETSKDARALWDSADVTRRRRLLSSLISKVRVSSWPKGVTTTPTRRTKQGETEDQFKKRTAEFRRDAMRKRVVIDWRA